MQGKDTVSIVRANTRLDDSSDEELRQNPVNGKEAITGMEKRLYYMEQGGCTVSGTLLMSSIPSTLNQVARRNLLISVYILIINV